MTIEDIARIVYEADRTYHKTLKNYERAPWEWYGDDNRNSLIESVKVFINATNIPITGIKAALPVDTDVRSSIFTSVILALKPFLNK